MRKRNHPTFFDRSGIAKRKQKWGKTSMFRKGAWEQYKKKKGIVFKTESEELEAFNIFLNFKGWA